MEARVQDQGANESAGNTAHHGKRIEASGGVIAGVLAVVAALIGLVVAFIDRDSDPAPVPPPVTTPTTITAASITVAPDAGQAGAAVQLGGSGFAAGERVRVEISGGPAAGTSALGEV